MASKPNSVEKLIVEDAKIGHHGGVKYGLQCCALDQRCRHVQGSLIEAVDRFEIGFQRVSKG